MLGFGNSFGDFVTAKRVAESLPFAVMIFGSSSVSGTVVAVIQVKHYSSWIILYQDVLK